MGFGQAWANSDWFDARANECEWVDDATGLATGSMRLGRRRILFSMLLNSVYIIIIRDKMASRDDIPPSSLEGVIFRNATKVSERRYLVFCFVVAKSRS
jgi:hypothetical protein